MFENKSHKEGVFFFFFFFSSSSFFLFFVFFCFALFCFFVFPTVRNEQVDLLEHIRRVKNSVQ